MNKKYQVVLYFAGVPLNTAFDFETEEDAKLRFGQLVEAIKKEEPFWEYEGDKRSVFLDLREVVNVTYVEVDVPKTQELNQPVDPRTNRPLVQAKPPKHIKKK